MSRDNKVTLKSSDDEMFEVDESVAYSSQTVKDLISEIGHDSVIPSPNVSGKVLASVIEYCTYHVESAKSSDDKPAISEDKIKQWDVEFVKVNKDTLFELILAANYLNIKNLLDLTRQAVADMIKSKTLEEIRRTLNFENDFTPEEEEQITGDIRRAIVYYYCRQMLRSLDSYLYKKNEGLDKIRKGNTSLVSS